VEWREWWSKLRELTEAEWDMWEREDKGREEEA
jgi:hypothetical protein